LDASIALFSEGFKELIEFGKAQVLKVNSSASLPEDGGLPLGVGSGRRLRVEPERSLILQPNGSALNTVKRVNLF